MMQLKGNAAKRSGRGLNRARRVLVPLVAVVASASAAAAENGQWTVLLEPTYMDAFGHDREVLAIRRIDSGATPALDTGSRVALDTEGTLTNRFGLEYSSARWEDWTLGFELIFFGASQGRPRRTAAADGPSGPFDQVAFEIPDRSFTSDGPGEELYFSVLGDTDLEVWTMDVYGVKTITSGPERRLRLVLGLRNADFDNDYHGVAGVATAGGSFLDAGSNYDRMLGPLVGFTGEIALGRNTLTGYIGQAVVFGSADLGRRLGDFVGPADAPVLVAQQAYERNEDVSIPMTELRVTWLHPIGERLSLGVTANASKWSDVPVPPDIVPSARSGANRNTVTFFGVGAAIRLRF